MMVRLPLSDISVFMMNDMQVGHQHSYERSCPVYQGNCVETGTVHVVVGSAGARKESSGFSPLIGNWSVAHANEYGYVRLDSSYDTLDVEFVLNKNGDVFDSFTVPKWT